MWGVVRLIQSQVVLLVEVVVEVQQPSISVTQQMATGIQQTTGTQLVIARTVPRFPPPATR